MSARQQSTTAGGRGSALRVRDSIKSPQHDASANATELITAGVGAGTSTPAEDHDDCTRTYRHKSLSRIARGRAS